MCCIIYCSFYFLDDNMSHRRGIEEKSKRELYSLDLAVLDGVNCERCHSIITARKTSECCVVKLDCLCNKDKKTGHKIGLIEPRKKDVYVLEANLVAQKKGVEGPSFKSMKNGKIVKVTPRCKSKESAQIPKRNFGLGAVDLKTKTTENEVKIDMKVATMKKFEGEMATLGWLEKKDKHGNLMMEFGNLALND